jgi:hypothetical protein
MGRIVGWETLSAWSLTFKYFTNFFEPHLATPSKRTSKSVQERFGKRGVQYKSFRNIANIQAK